MPPLLQSAQLKPDVTITSADSDNEIEDSDDDRYFLLEVHSLDIIHVFMHVDVVWDYLSLLISTSLNILIIFRLHSSMHFGSITLMFILYLLFSPLPLAH